ncbi:MAG TPA: nuclear transport factor 2 family protein [Steroidobacteraceae bacterium]|nr:nuclear transport factor 2 family protein [Steroidobacteraceae bacterium]
MKNKTAVAFSLIYGGMVFGTLAFGTLRSGSASAAEPMKLTAQDYLDIKALSARYAQVIEHCTNKGYDYAALYTPDGEFGRTDDWGVRPRQISKGPDELAKAAGGGPNGCDPKWMGDGLTHIIVDTVITPTPAGAHGKSILVILGLRGDPNRIERLGSYEDTYVKTPAGWRFKTRWHVFPIRAAAPPTAQ